MCRTGVQRHRHLSQQCDWNQKKDRKFFKRRSNETPVKHRAFRLSAHAIFRTLHSIRKSSNFSATAISVHMSIRTTNSLNSDIYCFSRASPFDMMALWLDFCDHVSCIFFFWLIHLFYYNIRSCVCFFSLFFLAHSLYVVRPSCMPLAVYVLATFLIKTLAGIFGFYFYLFLIFMT